jgi:hypothetical protein
MRSIATNPFLPDHGFRDESLTAMSTTSLEEKNGNQDDDQIDGGENARTQSRGETSRR